MAVGVTQHPLGNSITAAAGNSSASPISNVISIGANADARWVLLGTLEG